MKKILVFMLLAVAVLLSAQAIDSQEKEDSEYLLKCLESCNVEELNFTTIVFADTCYDLGDDIEVEIELDWNPPVWLLAFFPTIDIIYEVNLFAGNAHTQQSYYVTGHLTLGTETLELTVPTLQENIPAPWCIEVVVLWNHPCFPDFELDIDEECVDECEEVPVTLSAFTAVYDNSTPTLQWTTQSESNNLGWNIYRSLSENMGQANQINDLLIPGNGTTTEPTDYVYNDLSDVESNTSYWYWLESSSYNGETEVYGPVTLTIQNDENQLPDLPTASILHNNYPNPFNPSTMINFSINQGENGSLTILNAKGQVMETQNYEAGEHQFNWDATNYSSGIYFYKLETQNYTNIKKMIMVK